MNGFSVAGLAVVGGLEMQSSLVLAAVAFGAFGFLVSAVGLWQGGQVGLRLLKRAASLAFRGFTSLLVVVGGMCVLEWPHLTWAALALVGWWALPRRRRPLAAAEAPGGGGPEGDGKREEEVVASLSGTPLALLRAAWRGESDGAAEAVVRSFDRVALARAWAQCRAMGDPDPARAAEIVAIRGVILDEIEHRDPQAFESWLARGAADDPPVRSAGRGLHRE